jgi:hypothetical protein
MPIRYVTAIALAIAVLAVAFAGVDQFAQSQSEQQVEGELTKLTEAARELAENNEVPPRGQEGAQRRVTVTLPDNSFLTDPVTYVDIGRVANSSDSRIEYRIKGGAERSDVIDVPIVRDTNNRLGRNSTRGNDTFRLSGSGTHELVLTLERGENGDPVVTVRRASRKYQLVVNTESGGDVRIAPSSGSTTLLSSGSGQWNRSYDWGESVTLTAVPAGEEFDGWDGDVPYAPGRKTITVNMTKNREITGTFGEPELYSFSVKSGINGSVSLGGESKNKFNKTYVEGRTVEVTAQPKPGYRFINWQGEASGIAERRSVSVTVDQDRKIKSLIRRPERHELSVQSGRNVDIRVDGETRNEWIATYNEGETVEITAVPDFGYDVKRWEGDVPADADGPSVTVTMTEDRDVEPVVENVNVYELSVKAGSNGRIRVNGETRDEWIETYEADTEVEITAVPDSGYAFDSWRGDVSATDSRSITVTMDQLRQLKPAFRDVSDE